MLLNKINNYEIINNDHFLKSANIKNKYGKFKLEWVIKQQIPKNYIHKYKYINILNFEWCFYSEIVQIFHIAKNFNIIPNSANFKCPKCNHELNVTFNSNKIWCKKCKQNYIFGSEEE